VGVVRGEAHFMGLSIEIISGFSIFKTRKTQRADTQKGRLRRMQKGKERQRKKNDER
jgi:hypothetical protein